MNKKLTCPVCEHPEIEGNTCPNCETELSSLRMLVELPAVRETNLIRSIFKPWLLVSLGIFMLVIGVIGGASGYYLASKDTASVTQISPPNSGTASIPNSSPNEEIITHSSPSFKSLVANPKPETKEASCGGFYYTVRVRDSLSLIALKFYGDSESWSILKDANPELESRVNALKVGEILFLPNLKENCP